MNNITTTVWALLAMGIFFIINPAFAGDRVEIYELPESGITIEFPMTAAEIAAEDAEIAKRAARKQATRNNNPQRVNVYEMGESGQTFTFLMTAEEIAAADAENARRAALRKAKSAEPQRQVVVFELAESGVIIEFPVKTSDKFILEAFAEKNPSDDSRM